MCVLRLLTALILWMIYLSKAGEDICILAQEALD